MRNPRVATVVSRGVRTVRAGVASAIAVFVSLTFHVAAGGALPSPGVLVTVLVLAMPLAVLLIGRRLSTLRLTGVVVAAQAAFHMLFGLGIAGGLGGGAHAMHGAAPELSSTQVNHVSAMGPPAELLGGMTASHLVAAGLTVLVLRLGEGAFWALVALATWRLRRSVALRLQVLSAPRLPADPSPSLTASQLLAWCAVRHRGPPATA